MNSTRTATLVGITVFGAFLAVILSLFYLRGALSARDQVAYYAEFDNVGRLAVGDNVVVAGVTVGRVKMVQLTGRKARVDFYVGPEVRVGEGTLAAIDATDVFGSARVELHLGEGAPVAPGSRLEGSLGPGVEDLMRRSTVVIDQTVSLLRKAEILLERLNTLTAEGGAVTESLENTRVLTANVREFSTHLGDYDRLLRGTFAAVDSAVVGVDSLVAGNSGAVRRSLASFESSTARLDSVLAGLQSGEGTLGRLLADESLYRDMRDALLEARNLIAEVRDNPGKYVRVKVF